ncbi:RNA-binding protein 42 [Gryganskiella cystojenkinii]|nr:RNA-binding protein 42 [Gryganskiella cystojenkinii]
MSYANGTAGAGAGVGGMPQYTPEEIAYWASQGYVLDTSATTTAAVDPAAAYYSAQPPQQQSQPYGPTYPSIPSSSSSTYGAGSYNTNRSYGGGGRGYHHHQNNIINPEPEDFNKLFVDPKKQQEEAAAAAAKAEEEAAAEKAKAAATVIRKAAGQTWEDSTLLDFDENDFRLFAGDLGNEVTDDLLTKTFSKYPSFLKAKVVRDKRTQKSKGYGFISFAEPDDFARAWKEMDGKYVGNRPIKLRKSQWKDRNVEIVREPKAARGPYDPEALTRKERAKPYKVKKLNNAGK